jgi:hypothetical protein
MKKSYMNFLSPSNWRICLTIAFLIIGYTTKCQTSYGTNLIVNGDASSGTINDWNTTFGPTFLDATSTYLSALPRSGNIDGYVFDYFLGSTGITTEYISQTIDISDISATIATGYVKAILSGYVFKYYAADVSRIVLEQLDASNGVLAASQVENDGINVWQSKTITIYNLNTSTRKLKVTLYATLSGTEVSTYLSNSYVEFDQIDLKLYVPPTITGISPTRGPTAGGTSVIITGTNLSGATAVKFGSTNATGFTVNSATQITATSPSGSGTVDLTVTNSGGTSATNSSDRFTYVDAPTVTGISPTSGPTAGGTSVVITGTNLSGATAVKFGLTNATGYTVNSATQITATSPSGSGTVDLTVTNSGGTSATNSSDRFTYVAPTVSSVSVPSNGTYIIGQNLNFTVNFSEVVNVVTTGGTPYIPVTLNNGGTVRASYLSGSGTSAIAFRYTISSGDMDADGVLVGSSITANGGTLKSGNGTDANLTLNSVGSTTGVLVDGVSPSVLDVSSSTANGFYKAGDVVSIQVNFTEAVIVTGTPQLTLETGTTDRIINYAGGTGTSTLTFFYTVQAGDVSADLDYQNSAALALNGGTIKDAAGNYATLTLISPGALNSLGNNKAIVIDSVAPTVTSVNSSTANGSYKVGDVISIQVNFSEAVTVTGTPQLTLETSTTDRIINYASGTGTSALTFLYTVQAGDVSADLDYQNTAALALNGGTIRDAAGNNAILTLVSPGATNSLGNNKAIVIDGVAPTVTSVNSSTSNGSYKVGDVISIQVNFSEAVTVTGTPQLTLETGTTDEAVNYTSGTGTSTLIFTYTVQTGDASSDLDYKSTTALALNGGTIKDAAGNFATLTLVSPGAINSLGNNKAIVIDGVAPTVSSVSVPSNGTYIAGQNLDFTVNFDEAVVVNTGGGTPYFTLTIGSSSVHSSYLSGSGTSTLTFRYSIVSGNLDYDGIVVTSAILTNGGTLKDAAGNNASLTLNSVASTTGVLVDAVAPTVSSVSVPSNGTYIAGQNLDFTVSFDEAVVVNTGGGTPYFTLTIGSSSVHSSYLSGSGTSTLTFRYSIVSGNLDSDGIVVTSAILANGGTLKDAAGSNASLTLNSVASTTGVLVDAVAPTVSSVSVPSNGTYIAGQNLDFTVNFSQAVNIITSGGTPYIPITLNTGGIVHASYLSGSGTAAIAFRYTIASGNLDVDGVSVGSSITASGGTLKSGSGNDATLALSGVASTNGVLVDAVEPTISSINRLTPSSTHTNVSSVIYRVTFSENIRGIDVSDFSLTATGVSTGSIASLSASTGITIDVTVNSISGEGSLRLDLKSSSTGIADDAGNAISGGYISGPTYTIDKTAPTVSSINRLTPSTTPTNLSSVIYRVTFSENISGVDISDFSLTAAGASTGSIASVSSGTGTTLDVTVNSISGEGSLRLDFNSSGTGITDDAGNAISGGYTSGQTYTIDKTAPSVTVSSLIPDPTNVSPVPLSIVFSEAVTSFTLSDISVGNGTASNLQTSDNIRWTADISPAHMGAFSVNIYSGVAQDLAGNGNTASAYFQRTYDPVAPTISSVDAPSNATYIAGQNLDFVVNFSEDVIVRTSAGIPYLALTIGSTIVHAEYYSGSYYGPLTFRYKVTSGDLDSDGITVGTSITLNGGTIKDYAENNTSLTLRSVGSTTGVLVDAVAPTVSSVSSTTANGTYKQGDAISITVMMPEAVDVSGVPTIALNSGGLASYVSGSGTSTLTFSYTVGTRQTSADLDYSTINSLSLAGGTIKDAAGNNATLTLPTVGGASSLGGQKSIVIGIAPTVTTQAVSTITTFTASGNGNITDLGFPNPTSYGVCWNLSGAPTISDSKTDNGAASGTGAFTESITGLSAATTYYARAYATNSAGTSYGNEISFRTKIQLLISDPVIASKSYNGDANATVSTLGTLSGKEGSDDVSVVPTAVFDTRDVGTGKTVTISYSLSGLNKDKYAAPPNSVLTTGVITKKVLTITAEDKTKVYDGGVYSPFSVTYSGFISGENASILGGSLAFSGTATTSVNVGSNYVITPSGLTSANYDISFVAGKLDITKKALTITAEDKTKVYDGGVYSPFTVTYSGFIIGENASVLGGSLAFSGTATTAATVGSNYVITPSGLTAANYDISFVAGKLDITKKALTITAENKTKIYDGSVYSPFTVTYSGFITGENASVLDGSLAFSGTATTAATVGSNYVVTPSGLTSANYDISFVAGKLDITKKALTITAEDKSKVYDGGVYSPFTVTYSGFASGENASFLGGSLAFSGTATTSVNVGSNYVITPSGLTSANYDISFVAGKLDITKKALTITAEDKSKVYDGGVYSPFTVTYIGFISGENASVLGGSLAFSGTATTSVNVGLNYVITPSGLTADNYDISFVAGKLDITKKALTITAEDKSKVYDGGVYSPFTVTYSGFIAGENLSTLGGSLAFSGTATTAATVGTNYVITPSGLTADNYDISFVAGKLDITKKALTITAEDKSKVYDGGVYSPFTVTYSGFISGENTSVLAGTLAFSGTATTAVNVGTNYVITPSGLTADNYDISFVAGKLDITKKALTIAAEDKSKVYDGGVYSPFSVTYSGFISGENASVLAGTLAFSGTATTAANVGSNYVITPSGLTADNYDISFVAGKLDITKKALTITAEDKSKCYDGATFNGNFTISISGFAVGQYLSDLRGTLSFTGTANGATDAGSYTISPGGLTSDNYAITFKSGTLNIYALPVPSISGPNSVCAQNGKVTYITESGMNGYTWSVSGDVISGTNSNTIDVNWNTPGSQIVVVNYTAANGCIAKSSGVKTVTVIPGVGDAGNISGTVELCSGTQAVTYSTPIIPNADTYTWTLPFGATIVGGNGTNSILVDFSGNAASGSIFVNGKNQCREGKISPAFAVTINQAPSTPVLTVEGNIIKSSEQLGNQWYFQNTLITGATANTYQATHAGKYWTEVVLHGCPAVISNIVNLGNIEDGHFAVYPIPNKGKFTAMINTPSQETMTIIVYNKIGKKIYELSNVQVFGKFEKVIDLGSIPSGIYLVEFKNSLHSVIYKMMVNK